MDSRRDPIIALTPTGIAAALAQQKNAKLLADAIAKAEAVQATQPVRVPVRLADPAKRERKALGVKGRKAAKKFRREQRKANG